MADFDLDLDALAPESKKVKLGGKIIEVSPPKFKNLVSLMKTIGIIEATEGGTSSQVDAIEELRISLLPMIPALADDDTDLSIEQLKVLLQFVMRIAQPQEVEQLQADGYKVGKVEKKAEEEVSAEQSPTS